MKPLVSILIPAYNAEAWLPLTLESALSQTWPNLEIIVVNDGSRDGTLAVARGFEPRGVRVIDQANVGQSAAFNRALAEAHGEYYEFLDADDLLAPDKIEVQMQRLATLPPGWIASGSWSRFHEHPAEADFSPGPVARDLPPVDWLVAVWERHSMMHGAAWLIPAALAKRAGGWNPRLNLINDFEYFSRVLLLSEGIAYCGEARTYYRSGHPGRLSGSRSPAAWDSAFESTRLGTERLLAHENSVRTRAAVAHVWRNFIFDSYPDARPQVRRQAAQRLREFGVPLGRPVAGPWFTFAARIIGWKLARHLQLLRRSR